MYNGLCDVMWVQFAKTCRTMNEAKRSDIRIKVLVKRQHAFFNHFLPVLRLTIIISAFGMHKYIMGI